MCSVSRFRVSRFRVSRFRVSRFRVSRFRVSRFRVSRFRVSRFRVSRFSRFALSRFALSRFALSRFALSRFALSRFALSRFALSRFALSHLENQVRLLRNQRAEIAARPAFFVGRKTALRAQSHLVADVQRGAPADLKRGGERVHFDALKQRVLVWPNHQLRGDFGQFAIRPTARKAAPSRPSKADARRLRPGSTRVRRLCIPSRTGRTAPEN